MQSEKVFTHKGIKVKMNVDLESYKKDVVQPYKDYISVLEKNINKRDKYIKKVHTQLRNAENIFFSMYASVKINSLITNGLSLKRLIILNYLNGVDFAKADWITKYIKNAGINSSCSHRDINALESLGMISHNNVRNGHFITYKGKDEVKKMTEIYTSSINFYLKNKSKIVKRNPNRRVFKEHEKERARQYYVKMMTPLWESGLNTMPKSKSARIDIISKWIKNKIAEGQEIDELYYKLIQKWSV